MWPFTIWFRQRERIRALVDTAIAEHGRAAEAYLNYPLQDRKTDQNVRRDHKRALREIRRRHSKE